MTRAERTLVTKSEGDRDHGVRCLGGVMGDAHGGVTVIAGTRDPPCRLSAGISIGDFAVLLVGFALWVAYGLARHDLPLVLPNSLALLVTTFTIVVALRHRP